MEFRSLSLSRSTLEFEDNYLSLSAHSSRHGELQEQEEQLLVSSLRIRTPSSIGEFEEDDGFTTPTSLDRRIPVNPRCPPPPPPRKAKSLPLSTNKRKSASQQILLDFSTEVESLFPPSLLADLGRKIKKFRKSNAT